MSYDKCRFAFRGNNRKRYSVFKAQWNRYWENIYQRLTEDLCEAVGLDVEEQMVEGRTPWYDTYNKLRAEYGPSRSIRDIQAEYDEEQTEFP